MLLQVVALDLPSIGQVSVKVLFPSTRKVPSWVVATWRISFESLNQLSATTIGEGNATPRLCKAARRPSSMPCTQQSLSRQGAQVPADQGDGWQNPRAPPVSPRQRPRPAIPHQCPRAPGVPGRSTRCPRGPTARHTFEHRVIAHPGPLPAAARGCLRWRHDAIAGSAPPGLNV